MRTLIIYDANGYLISNVTGDYRVPVGVPYLEIEVPEGKRIKNTNGIAVDVSVTPHQVMLEDIPPSEVDELKKQLTLLQTAFDEFTGVI